MRTVLNILSVVAIVCFAVGCGSSQSLGKKVKQDECEKMAYQQTSKTIRGYGVAQSPEKQFSIDIATVNARNSIAGTLNAKITSLHKKYMNQYSGVNIPMEVESKNEQEIMQLINGSVSHSVPVCANTYLQKNGNYETHVCVELKSDFSKQMYDTLKDQFKGKLDISQEDFEKELELELRRNADSK